VKQLTILITPEGQLVLPATPEFFAALGDPDPDYDAVAFAVRNLGFIKYQVIERTIVEIEIHPRIVSLQALLVVQQQLQSSPVKLFRIKSFDTAWNSEISSSAEQTITRLSELCAPAFRPPASERFHVEPQDIGTLFQNEDNPLRPLAQKWRMSFRVFDPTVISLAVTHQLLPRLVIAGLKPRQSDPIWRFIGDGHNWLGHKYKIKGIGEKIADIPDKDYGLWATEFYTSVATSGQPRFDVVTGSVRYEDESGKPVKPVRYERLMLPWKTSSDEVFVTACTRRFGMNDIPVSGLDPYLDASTFAMSS
jgi:hypothetical protein